MPTSITVAPGRTMSAVTNSGFPIATTRMSAERQTAGRSRDLEWQTVTVASPPFPCWISRLAIGLPTMFDRPTMTALAPLVSMPERISICCTPKGVAGLSAVGSPMLELADVDRVKAVHVLGRDDRVEHPLAVDVLRQRELHQEAVDPGIGVEPLDHREQLGLGASLGQADGLRVHPRLVARLALGLHVDLARRVLADDHHRQAGLPAAAGVVACTASATSARIALARGTPSRIRALIVHNPRLGSPG